MDEKRLYMKAKRIGIHNRLIMNGLAAGAARRTYRHSVDRQSNLPELLPPAIQTYRMRLGGGVEKPPTPLEPTDFLLRCQRDLPGRLWKTGRPPPKPTANRQSYLAHCGGTRQLNLPGEVSARRHSGVCWRP